MAVTAGTGLDRVNFIAPAERQGLSYIGYACNNCVKESEAKIIKRIDKKIAHLKRQKDILIK